jgi:hypothetical protein
MTDAALWRKIARTKAWGEWGLCSAIEVDSSNYVQGRRMEDAVTRFCPPSYPGFYWPRSCPEGDEQRIWAALFLAAMAEADGGNHAEEET